MAKLKDIPIYGSNSKVMLENGLYGLLGASEKYILEYAEGNPITLKNIRDGTVETELTEFRLFGWSQQNKTTGAQLFDLSKAEDNKYQQYNTGESKLSIVAASNYWITGFIELNPNTSYSTNMDVTGVFYNSNKQPLSSWIVYNARAFRTPPNTKYVVLTFEKSSSPFSNRFNLMLNEGSQVKSYETYSNGFASPSVDYPQYIECAGSNGDLTISIGVNEQTLQYKLCGIQVPETYEDYTYMDEYGQKWVADELDLVSGNLIRRIEASETDGLSILQKQGQELISKNILALELHKGNAVISNNASAYMKVVYKATGS